MFFTFGGRRRWGAFLASTVLVAALVFMASHFWRAIAEWWKAPWIGSFVIALSLLAAGVTLIERKMSPWQKAIFVLLMGLLAILEFRSLKISDDKSKEAQQKLNESFSKLLDGARDTIANMTGGDSFPYVDLEVSPRMVLPKVKVEGRYVLRNLQLRVLDADIENKMRSYSSAVSVREWALRFKAMTNLSQVSSPNPAILDESSGIDTNPDSPKAYVFEISATNGTWKEYLRAVTIDGYPEKAIMVLELDDRKPESEWVKRKNWASPGFPRLNGQIDWDIP